MRRGSKRKVRKTEKRVSAALTRFLRKQNPAFKRASGVLVKKNRKTGGITFTPMRRNISEGFVDAGGTFHPIRGAKDYSRSRAGESASSWSAVKKRHGIK